MHCPYLTFENYQHTSTHKTRCLSIYGNDTFNNINNDNDDITVDVEDVVNSPENNVEVEKLFKHDKS